MRVKESTVTRATRHIEDLEQAANRLEAIKRKLQDTVQRQKLVDESTAVSISIIERTVVSQAIQKVQYAAALLTEIRDNARST